MEKVFRLGDYVSCKDPYGGANLKGVIVHRYKDMDWKGDEIEYYGVAVFGDRGFTYRMKGITQNSNLWYYSSDKMQHLTIKIAKTCFDWKRVNMHPKGVRKHAIR